MAWYDSAVFYQRVQYLFFRQYEELREYAKQKNAGGTKMDFNMIELPNAALGKTLYDLLNEEDKKFCIMDINEEDSKCFAYDFVNKNYVEVFYKKK